MTRELLKSKKFKKPSNSKNRKEYTPPDGKVVDSELLSILMQNYIEEQDDERLNLWDEKKFESKIQTIGLVIEELTDKLMPQFLIDTLTLKLRDESERWDYSRAMYLTAIVQALYNLGCSDEFVIDTRDWPEERHNMVIGRYLQGEDDRPLTLNLYGKVGMCGNWAEHCHFTIHDQVKWCGLGAEYCRFNMMPGARIEEYVAGQLEGNVRRKMNEGGEWEIIGWKNVEKAV